MKIKLISHACFKIELSNTIIYFDPYEIPKNEDKADIILASHDHYDHFEEKAVKSVMKKDTAIIGPKTCRGILSMANSKGLSPGESIKLGDITISAIPAYNVNKRFHPKGNSWLGYIIDDGKIKIYHAGDTDFIPEMKGLEELKIDFALLPVGDTYTMGFNESVDALMAIKPKNFIPMHTWDKDLTPLIVALSKKMADLNVIALNKGKEFP